MLQLVNLQSFGWTNANSFTSHCNRRQYLYGNSALSMICFIRQMQVSRFWWIMQMMSPRTEQGHFTCMGTLTLSKLWPMLILNILFLFRALISLPEKAKTHRANFTPAMGQSDRMQGQVATLSALHSKLTMPYLVFEPFAFKFYRTLPPFQ